MDEKVGECKNSKHSISMNPKLEELIVVLHCIDRDQGYLDLDGEQERCCECALHSSKAQHHVDTDGQVIPDVQK